MPSQTESEFDYEASLLACAAGRPQALEALYQQESPRLLGVARRIVTDAAMAEDIVHDTFVKIWQQAASFEPSKGSARGWIYTITRHLALNVVRDRSKTQTSDDAAVQAYESDQAIERWRDTQEAFDWRPHAGRMGPCLEQLEPQRRNCILHAYVDGLSHSEIARRIDAPLGTVKAWITRSLKALKECLA